MTLCFATGSIYRMYKSLDKQIERIKRFNFDGIELTLGKVKQLRKFKLKQSAIKYLRTLKYNSVHAPFGHNFKNTTRSRNLLKKIEEIASLINAKHINFHPHKIKHYDDILNMRFKATIENMEKGAGVKSAALKKIFRKHPKLGYVLDTTHPTMYSVNKIGKLYRLFKNKLTAVHLSGAIKGKLHQPLSLCSKALIEELKFIKKLKVPIIIEENFGPGEKGILEKEIKFIREMLE
ncbi:MAG: hypothetical protein Q7J54_06055 [Candidatus Woesearchaeota archaeon]|nr:hypothetical protein [Candidatus Woesearchaeota archaeon]